MRYEAERRPLKAYGKLTLSPWALLERISVL